MNDSRFLTGLCTTCWISLNKHEKGDFKKPVLKMPSYNKILFPKKTSSKVEQEYLCDYAYICAKARYRGHKKTQKQGFFPNKQ